MRRVPLELAASERLGLHGGLLRTQQRSARRLDGTSRSDRATLELNSLSAEQQIFTLKGPSWPVIRYISRAL